MDKADKKTTDIKKLSTDAYKINMEDRKYKINAEITKVDREIRTKSDRLVQALEDLKNKNKELKELEMRKQIH